MHIYVNDEPTPIEPGLTLAGLLAEKGMGQGQSLAVAVNDTVVSKGEWDHLELQADDRLLLIAPVGGG